MIWVCAYCFPVTIQLPTQFAKAKEIARKYDTTFTEMFTYYKNPTWRVDPVEDYCMPFIGKLYAHTQIIRHMHYPVRVDPSVQVSTLGQWHLFDQDEIMLHHFSMVRNDIQNKFRNAAASIRWGVDEVEMFLWEWDNAKPGDHINYFQGRKIIQVPDVFGLTDKHTTTPTPQ